MSPEPVACLNLLGAPEWVCGEGTTRFVAERRFQLLAYLAMHGGQWVQRDQLAAMLWPGHETAAARRNLRKVIFRARELPGLQGLVSTEHALAWNVETDLHRCKAALQQGDLDALLNFQDMPPMAGLDDPLNAPWSDWLAAERERWQAQWHSAVMSCLERTAAPGERARGARALLTQDPLDEEALLCLMRAEQEQGHVGAAQAAFRRYAECLAETLGVEPSSELRALARPIPTGAASAAALPAAGEPHRSFVGRRAELQATDEALRSGRTRWLTLLGPGGVGKSRLARVAMEGLSGAMPGGCLWVEMQDLVTTDALLERIAHQLDVQGGAEADPLAPLLARLGDERWLWILDNAEHLVQGPRPLGAWISALLERAPGLSVLVTSRTRLHGRIEQVRHLHGLPVPDEESRDGQAAAAFDAVKLFVARARAADSDFALEAHAAAVVEIVERVGGMPLAIELAAGWVRLLPPAEIARDLRESMDVLERERGSTDPPARPDHHSLRRVLASAWDLLAPRERQTLIALSVCRGGATLSAARAIAEASLPLLSSLVDRSMLSVDARGRFGMHPILQVHAAEHLAAEPAAQARAQQRHADFYARLLAELAPHALGDTRKLIDAVSEERANAEVAWSHALREQRADRVYAMVRALWSYFEHRGQIRDGLTMLKPALALPVADATARRAHQRLRHGLSMLHHRNGNQREGLALAAEGIALGDLGDLEAWVGCHLNAGSCELANGRPEAAHARFTQALNLSLQRQDRHCEAWARGNLGVGLHCLDRLDEAVPTLQQALAMDRELGNQYSVAVHLVNLALAHQARGEWESTRRYAEEGLVVAQAQGLGTITVALRMTLASVHEHAGQLAQARLQLEQGLEAARVGGITMMAFNAECNLAAVQNVQGEWRAAHERMRRLAASVQDHGLVGDQLALCSIYAEWLRGRRRVADAACVWLMVADCPEALPFDRERWRQRAKKAWPADIAPACTLQGVLSALVAESADVANAAEDGQLAQRPALD